MHDEYGHRSCLGGAFPLKWLLQCSFQCSTSVKIWKQSRKLNRQGTPPGRFSTGLQETLVWLSLLASLMQYPSSSKRPGRTPTPVSELHRVDSLWDDDPKLRDGSELVGLESWLDILCFVSAIEDWTAGNDLGMLAGSPGHVYACTAKPGPGVFSSLLQSWILGWIF